MANDDNFFAHGSRWIRADFHLHTRRDKEFKDTGSDQDFVARYIGALKKSGIRVGTITNHNKFDRDEFRALRKAAKKECIYLMPGIELYVKDGSSGIHTLVVFQKDWIDNEENKDYINSFLGLTFAGQSGYENSNARSNHNLIETIRELDKFKKDFFLIFAHVEDKNGLWGGLDGGRIEELGKNEVFQLRTAGFQKVRTRDKREKVKEQLGGWYPAEVEGSDPKNMDEIGRGKTISIKIGAFTFEAVQLALKSGAERSCLGTVQQQLHSYVRSIRFEGGILDGKSFEFSPEMNCLIGIRGSGKSSILECLRYGLELPMPESSDETDLKYKQELVRFSLKSGGKVVIETENAQGQLFEVHRILGDRRDIYNKGELLPGLSPSLKNPLFFGQKELVKRGEGSEDELVERLIGSKLGSVRKEITTQRQRVLDALGNLDKLKNLDAIETEYQNKERDTEFRLEVFREHGVEEQLKRRVQFNNDVTSSRRVVESVESFVRSFDVFLNEQESEFAALPRLESEKNANVIQEISGLLDEVRKIPEKVRQTLEEAGSYSRALREKLVELERRREALKEEFAAIERRLSEQLEQNGNVSVRPDDFVKLKSELQRVNLALSETSKSQIRRDGLQTELLKELKSLNNLWHREFEEIEEEVKKLNSSQTVLKIIPLYKGNRALMLAEMRNHFKGSWLRESALESVLDEYGDFISVYQSLDAICNNLGESGDTFRRFFNDAKASLLTWQVPNVYRIMYHGKDLREHSLGQRASALILFILSRRDNDLIVIDQPEDDLDNQTIFKDVIKLICTLKKGIQFIFATHNANFPVLGDAEQVGACSFTAGAGSIKIGSIDDPKIQKEIVSIMEGGQEAFARRKEIYQLWKQ